MAVLSCAWPAEKEPERRFDVQRFLDIMTVQLFTYVLRTHDAGFRRKVFTGPFGFMRVNRIHALL
jgi:hypothetical protein